MRVAIYTRVSTQDQKTLPLQLKALRKYAKAREWKIVLEVQDIASGVKERKKRTELLHAARQREIDAILVWKLGRWGRSLHDLITSLNELSELGVGFVSLTEAVDLTTSIGRAMAGVLAVFAQFERDMLGERVRAGIAYARKRGGKHGRPRTASRHAAKIKQLFSQGLTKSEIARKLNIGRTSVIRILMCAALVFPWVLPTGCFSQPSNERSQIGKTIYVKPKGIYAAIDTSSTIKMRDQLVRGTAEQRAAAIKSITAAPDKYQPPVFYYLAKVLIDEGKKDDAVFWFCAGQLRCRYDAQLCTDVTARSGMGAMDRQFGPFFGPYMLENKAKLATIVDKVVEWDRKTPYNYDHRWINLHGLAAMSIGPEDKPKENKPLSVPQSEWTAIADTTRRKFLENYHNIISPPPKKDIFADARASDEYGKTGLMAAAQKGDVKLAKELITQGANVNAVDKHNNSPLFYALGRYEGTMLITPPRKVSISPQQEQVVRLLISKGANVNAIAEDDYTPLCLAARSGDLALVQALMTAGASANARTNKDHVTSVSTTPLMEGATGGNIEVVELLVKHGADVNACPKGPESNITARTSLTCAIEGRNIEVVKSLIDHGANVKVTLPQGTTALMLAARRHNGTELVQAMIKAGAKVSGEGSYGQTVISEIAGTGSVETVKMLMAKGAKINPKGTSGRRALWEAVAGKNAALVKFFIAEGVDPKMNTPRGESLLVDAVKAGDKIMNGDPKIVQILLDAGVNPNEHGKADNTPLITAAERRNLPIVRMLLQRGADVNTISELSKRSALIAACVGFTLNADIVQALLDAGADINVRDGYDHKTALDYVRARTDAGASEIVALLKQHGAR